MSRVLLCGLYVLLLVGLTVGSTGTIGGDSAEYRAMTEALARVEKPPIFVHFWAYPALVAPFHALAGAAGVEPNLAFTLVNVFLLACAAWAAFRAFPWWAVLLVLAGPIVWWVDKAHTEIFTCSLLTIAVAILSGPKPDTPHKRINPGWAVLILGLATAQNPPAAVLIPLAVLLGARPEGRAYNPGYNPGAVRGVRSRMFWALCLGGVLLAAVNPLYNFVRLSDGMPLRAFAHGGIPNVDEFTAVVRDLNIGLVPNVPLVALAFLVAGIAVVATAPKRALGGDLVFAIGGALALLLAFSQAGNVNHGGTFGPSRYAMWLVPLGLPWLRRADEMGPTVVRVGLGVIAVVSAFWSVVMFHPSRPDGPGGVTAIANWVWSRHPAWDRPLPEIFIERLGGGEGRWDLPATTPGCEKILLIGRGPGESVWPIPCVPATVPPACAARDALCYANRRGETYDFSHVPRPSFGVYGFAESAVWTPDEARVVGALLREWRVWDMRVCDFTAEAVVRSGAHTGSVRHYCAGDRVVVYVQSPEQGAVLLVRLPARMAGTFIDAKTGDRLSDLVYDGPPGELWSIDVPAGRGSVVLAMAAADPA